MKTVGRKAVTNKTKIDCHCISVMFIIDNQLSRWEWVKQWTELHEINQLLDVLKKTSKPELFRDDENFYYEQKKITRNGYLNEEIDIDYGESSENRQKENQFQNKEDEEFVQLSGEVNLEVSNSDLLNSTFKYTASSVTMNHSGVSKMWRTSIIKV